MTEDDVIEIAARRSIAMDMLIVLLIVITGLVALGMAANAFGVDSRDVLPDDHRR
jgi:hypothetical protein